MHPLHFRTRPFSTVVVMLAGNVGVGKRSVAVEAGRRFGWDVHIGVAPEQNRWLKALYKDIKRGILPSREAFRSELFFLVHWAKEYEETLEQAEHGVLIFDHCLPFDTYVFAMNLADLGYLEEAEWELYQDVHYAYCRSLPAPSLLVHLYTSSVEILLQRIRQHGRAADQVLEPMYLRRIDAFYAQMMNQFDHTNRISINVDTIELDDPSTFENVLSAIYTKVNELAVPVR